MNPDLLRAVGPGPGGRWCRLTLPSAFGRLIGTRVAWIGPDPDEPSSMLMIESRYGDQLGIEFKSDGSFQVGGWDEEGEWTPLVVRKECEHENCKANGHSLPFHLNQYTEALKDADT